MQVVNFIQVPTVETNCIVFEIFKVMQHHLKLFCFEKESVCEIREKSLIVTTPIDIYLEFKRSSLYSLFRMGFDIMHSEPFTHKSFICLSICFDFNHIPKNLKIFLYKKNKSLVLGKGLQEILVDNFLWINRFRDNPQSL